MSITLQVKKVAQLTGHNASIFAVIPHDLPSHFLSGAGDGWIVRWNFDDPELGRLIAKVETQIFALLALPDHEMVVAGNMNGGIHWVDLQDPEQTKNIAHHQKGTFGLVRVENFVFSIGGGGVLTKWQIDPVQSLESYQLSNQPLRSIDHSAYRNELVVGSSDNGIYILDATTLALKKRLPQAHENSVFTAKYHPNHRYLLSGGRDAMLKVWDLNKNYELINQQPAHWFTINSIVFHPKGHWFATGSRDKTIKIWDAQSFKLLKVVETIRDKGHINSVNNLFWFGYHDYLVSCSDDRSMIVWEVVEGE